MSKFVRSNDALDSGGQVVGSDATQTAVDNRSLFEKLQEQKAAKEDAFNEAAKFSNLIRRLDNDEVDFLANVNEEKEREEARKKREQDRAIEGFRTAQRAVDNMIDQLGHHDKSGTVAKRRSQAADTASAAHSARVKRSRPGVVGVVTKDRKRSRKEGSSRDAKVEGEETSTVQEVVPAARQDGAKDGQDEPIARHVSNLIDYRSDSDG